MTWTQKGDAKPSGEPIPEEGPKITSGAKPDQPSGEAIAEEGAEGTAEASVWSGARAELRAEREATSPGTRPASRGRPAGGRGGGRGGAGARRLGRATGGSQAERPEAF